METEGKQTKEDQCPQESHTDLKGEADIDCYGPSVSHPGPASS